VGDAAVRVGSPIGLIPDPIVENMISFGPGAYKLGKLGVSSIFRYGARGIATESLILSKAERLTIFNHRLLNAAPANSADDALALLTRTMDEVEDAFSGVAKVENPGLKYAGRMYAPRQDFITRLPNGGLQAKTAGNTIVFGPDGSIEILDRAGNVVLKKAGGR
jgi:hypothetical protein